MPEKYEQLLVRTDTFEPFVLCLALGTLEAMKSKIWTTEAGVWTIGRPTFLNKLEEMKVSGETMDVLVQFDELNALEKFVEKEAFYNEILKIEQIIKNRLKDFSKDFWYAKWTDQAS
ncbi:MAG: hypothetical protein JWN60_937 [Acidobacteria bacterium]|jgi:hypothetical protein|nr:hypothetical protein [Acidobacteriota bacterium]